MGKITQALKKAAEDRLSRIDKKPQHSYVVKIDPQITKDLNIDEHVVAFSDPRSPVAEQYKTLRTNLLSLSSTARPIKTIAITSSINSEGKTITALNLAITMAHDLNNKSILFVDADLRKSRIHKILGIDKVDSGLSEYLQDSLLLNNVLIKTGIENLTLLPAGKGPKNPAELLSSYRMRDLLKILKNNFDYIIIDAPPVLPVTDPSVIGAQVDGVLMVIQAGRTQRNIVQHAKQLLDQARVKVLGYVMTSVEYHLPQYLYRYM
ncbi:MAG: CpsD/CapB family tyrosine-protein kinase [Candidatus Omnitrophica bacterium]|nr:CpsD/CapB family tyrosine-protein kinase [Candidatus Omnitrophota bacterium]